jgi:hypothetical protein
MLFGKPRRLSSHNPILAQVIGTQAARFGEQRFPSRFVRIHLPVGGKQQLI